METLEQKKKNLQRQLDAIETIEHTAMQNKHYPKFKKIIGRCFKFRNSYGGESKKWWLYSKVVDIKPEHIYMIGDGEVTAHCRVNQFQTSSEGRVSVEHNYPTCIHSIGQEISLAEYNREKKKLLESLKSI